MNQKFKILFLLNFLLINLVFSKELPSLFQVTISSDQYTNTSDGLNKAFNRLIQKLHLNIPLDSTKTTVHNKSRGQELTPEELDPESLRLIKKRYVIDFKLFGYSYLEK